MNIGDTYMILNISTDIYNQTDLIQQIIDGQPAKDSHNYFLNKLIDSAASGDIFPQGIYCYALASLFYKYRMFDEALEYADKALVHFTQAAAKDPTVKNLFLWNILELGYINCARGNINNAKALINQYEEINSSDSPVLKHHFILLKIRVLLCSDELRNDFSDIFDVLELENYSIVRRHFIEYVSVFEYFLNTGMLSPAKQLIDLLSRFNSSNPSPVINRQYWTVVTEYYRQIGDKKNFEKAFIEFERYTIARKELFRQAKLETISNEETVFHQHELKDKLKNKVDRLKKVSQTDPLTGLPNRYLFNEYGQEAFNTALEKRQALGIILIDIDNFKHYNDTYGHLIGDQCLSLVGQVMRDVFNGFFISRYGGDEFIVIFIDNSAEEIIQHAKNFREQLKEHTFITTGGKPFAESITVSQGIICMIPEKYHFWSDFFHAADTALYTGKMNGRNGLVYLPTL